MFGLFGRRSKDDGLIGGQIGKMIDQMALATAVADAMAVYFRQAKILPISTDKAASAVDIWNGTRFEAVSHLWNFGAADLDLIINPTLQPKLIDEIIKYSVTYLTSREPKDDAIADTISAILRVYDYLERLEHEVAVPFHQSNEKNPGFVSKYGPFVEQTRALQVKWQGFHFALNKGVKLPEQPDTLFSLLWRDLTRRSKMIALCARFGPSYLDGMNYILDYAAKAGGDMGRPTELIASLLSADDPDQLISTSRT